MPEKTLAQIEREAIEQRLALKGGNRTHAAKSLGINRRTLQRKILQLKLASGHAVICHTCSK